MVLYGRLRRNFHVGFCVSIAVVVEFLRDFEYPSDSRVLISSCFFSNCPALSRIRAKGCQGSPCAIHSPQQTMKHKRSGVLESICRKGGVGGLIRLCDK